MLKSEKEILKKKYLKKQKETLDKIELNENVDYNKSAFLEQTEILRNLGVFTLKYQNGSFQIL